MKSEHCPIYVSQDFVIEPCRSCPLPGYLIVRPKLPVASLSALAPDSAAQLGMVLRLAVAAVETVLHPIKVYVAQFGEEDGNLHFHVFPRTQWLTENYLREFPAQKNLIHGPLLLDWARDAFRSLPGTQASHVSDKLRLALEALAGAPE